MKLKETIEDVHIVEKICSILTPQEFTRVDGIIDIVFSTAEDLDLSSDDVNESGDEEQEQEEVTPGKIQRVAFYDQCITRIEKKLQLSLTKQSRTTYKSPNYDIAVSCSVSKKYNRNNKDYYWFAFHPAQKQHLEKAKQAYVAFGCGSENILFLVLLEEFVSWLPGLNKSIKGERYYWHVQISELNGKWLLLRKTGQKDVDISKYLI